MATSATKIQNIGSEGSTVQSTVQGGGVTPTSTTSFGTGKSSKERKPKDARVGQEDESRRDDTLYDATTLKDFTARRVEPEDILDIKQFLRDEDYTFFRLEDPAITFERACFSIVLSDIIEAERIVAAAFLDDKPINGELKKSASEVWREHKDLQKLNSINTLYMHMFARSMEVKAEILLTEIVAHTFNSCPNIEYIVVECFKPTQKDCYAFCSSVKEVEIHVHHNHKQLFIIYDKDFMFPPLTIREGRENDLDDLAQLVPLTPEVLARDFGKSFLTDVIALGERNNQSIVAEWNYEAVGILTASTDVNYDLLNNFYHLEPFLGLHKPHPKDRAPKKNYYETRSVIDIPISVEKMMDEAKFAMTKLRGKRKKQRPEDPLPYTVETKREEQVADYDSEDSLGMELEDVHNLHGHHQFTTRVSHDIIAYGLRTESVIETLTEQQLLTSRMENIKAISEQLKKGEAAKDETFEEEAAEDEEEEEEGDEEEEGEEEQEDEVSKEREDEGIVEKESESSLRLAQMSQENNMLDFFEEFMQPPGMEEDEDELLEGDELEGFEEMSHSGSSGDKSKSPSSESLDSQMSISPTLEKESSTGDGDEDKEEGDDEANEMEDEENEEEKEGEEESGEEGSLPRVEDSQATLEPVADDEHSKRSKALQSKSFVPRKTAKSKMLGAGRKTGGKSFFGHKSHGGKSWAGKSMAGKSYAKSGGGQDMMGPLLDTVGMFPEYQKRWSDDTLYLGRTGTDKAFEDKVEVMKKVWSVFEYMKQEGLTLEAAVIHLTAVELSSIEEADIMTKGNLLKFMTLLFPDEAMYPFDRYVKPKVPKYHGLPNAIVLNIFNMDNKFCLRSIDMFTSIFKYFPNREYLIVTVAHGTKEPAWLDNFVRVVPRIDCSYPYEMFVLHKAFLIQKLKVRRGKQKDIAKVIRLLETLKTRKQILDDFKHAVCCQNYHTFVVEAKNHQNTPIVGVAIVSDEPESQIYHVNYKLHNHIYYPLHNTEGHAYVHHLILYPIFQRFGRTFMKEIMRLMDKTCLYQRIYPPHSNDERVGHQTLVNGMEDWIPVTPRKKIDYNDLNLTYDSYDMERRPPVYVTDCANPFGAIFFGKKFTFEGKINLSTRIVFVGASETTLACVEKMISSSFRGFKKLTIIDQFGLPGHLPPDPIRDELFALRKGGTAMSYKTDAEWVKRLGVQHWANVVVGTVTRIVRDKKHVVIDKETIVPYDILVLAPGKQFQRIDCPDEEVDDPNFLAFKTQSQKHRTQREINLTFKKDVPKPKNIFTINTEAEADIALKFIRHYLPFMKRKKILIYGWGLRCYACIKALLSLDIPPARIVLITVPITEAEREAREGYHVAANLRLPIENELRNLGVHLIENYEFADWETCVISGLVKRSYFFSPTETDSRISFATYCIFCFRHLRVNDVLVSALAESYLLYQDGIVIDEAFKTNDPHILAAGPATTYKKILLSNGQDHTYYQSEEVGHQLADYLIETVGNEGGGGVAKLNSMEVPKMSKPFVRAIELVGDWYYMIMKKPGASSSAICSFSNETCEEPCLCASQIVTGSVDFDEDPRQQFFKVRLDDRSRIMEIECMSRAAFSFSNFTGLYGQHEVLLNKMMDRLDTGEVKNLYDHFHQPWFAAFCNDQWDSFLSELRLLYKDHDTGSGQTIFNFIRDYVANLDNPDAFQLDPNAIRNVWERCGLKQEVELKFLAFLKFQKFSLPIYARNDYVEDLLEERSTSTLYFPKLIQY